MRGAFRVAHYERTDLHRGYAKGHKPRKQHCELGTPTVFVSKIANHTDNNLDIMADDC